MVDDNLIKSLYKKALGYTATEKAVEYSPEGDVTKRKVTSKHYPPDISALKTYLELSDDTAQFRKLSDEELQEEKMRLIKLLEEEKDATE